MGCAPRNFAQPLAQRRGKATALYLTSIGKAVNTTVERLFKAKLFIVNESYFLTCQPENGFIVPQVGPPSGPPLPRT
jgi:hypothetical protein